MLHTCNMKLLRRVGLSLSALLIPALVLNPAPAHARVLDPGSPVTSWGNNGVVELWETGASGEISITNQDVFEDNSGRYVFAARETIGVTEFISVRAISANGTQAFNYVLPETTYDFTGVSQFDIDASGRYIVGAEVNINGDYEFAVVRVNANGSIDTSFASQGVINFQTKINSYLNSLNSGCTGLVNIKDLATDPIDSSIYVLGSVTPYCTIAGFDSSQTRLWRIDSMGNIDTTFGTGSLEAFPITGDSGMYPFGSSREARIKTYDGLTLTLITTGHDKIDTSNFELFHQDIDISGAVPTAIIQPNQKTFNSSRQQSELVVTDFDVRNDGKISIIGTESIENTNHGFVMLLSPSSNRWDYLEFETDCYFLSVIVDSANNTYVSRECGYSNQSYTDSILKYSVHGERISFTGPQGSFGARSDIDYFDNKLFVDSSNVTAIGTALNKGGMLTKLVFGARYHVNSVTIPDPPPPAAPVVEAAPAPAPAPIVAPALPTQSAPVAIPAGMKVKKKLKFPITSKAGNPLKVTASGSCKVSPVFKKVKVKVGKKTKKVKKQTGWTVQMKKKKKTCTITQTDAGGNGYAPLSSTSTVTIK